MATKEQLSALMDGDLSDVEVLSELGMDPALQDTWSRYHLIGDAMRGDLPVNLQLDLSDSIMAALEDEPTILAPKPVESKPAAPQVHTGAKVVPLFRRVGQQVGQYAIAASVAAAVIFGVQQYQGHDGIPTNPVLNTIPVGGSASPVSVHYPQDGNRATARQQGLSEQQMQEQRERINAFLRDHQLQQRLLQDKQIQE
ncbi:RseA family anti-sigma factor [Aeromonas sp. MR19]|jgi:sigma-E factor negative regulatory protein RseA|uniref:Anti-sigma-E factor RseA n=1 Tax=Aeromonas bestiarum TaxID=105751 RepID=A0ABT7Q2E1_9GAMM|nr:MULTISPECIES: RseA family anti-sigma factor [Aeromonas]ATL97217.1 transcriptional regulator [Aeromonas sp. CA23]MCH7377359.1 RseA family anti-sigma factor [Aeromonas sp. MR19]MCX7133777.1 RseA family anti-sigma factor [Aeromonas sp.]MDM5073505.1 RseA family anti-sigma factor [Aeromonas bestiarum]MDM5091219.1 RseA family anti-sigma factor [Aeromonas bestiarum]